MDLKNVEILLEKYLHGEASFEEENELRNYFSSENIPSHLEQYRSKFDHFSDSKTQNRPSKKKRPTKNRLGFWVSIMASIAVLKGLATYIYYQNEVVNQDLGTYDNPELALKETQKALAVLSIHINSGIESVMYIKEYKKSKNLIFKQ